MLVTDDGLVTQTILQMTGTAPESGDLTTSFQFTVTGVNETAIEEPDYLDQGNTTG